MTAAAQRGPGHTPLTRAGGHGREPAPVRQVHLGLGNFFRAHQAVYTDLAPDAAEWGVAAFTGRSPGLAEAMSAQDGLYTLITQADDGNRYDVVSSVSGAHPGMDHATWLAYLRAPQTRLLTLTVTEAAYLRRDGGGLDHEHPQVQADVAALRRDSAAGTGSVPGRLVAGLAARREADAGPLAVVPCDNLPGNGEAVWRVVTDMAERVDPGLAGWVEESVSFVTTMVDRITPRTSEEDVEAVLRHSGLCDRCPVVTEPFTEWVLAGRFPGGRPRWEESGAAVVEDVRPFEERKLWLLNGAHSLLAYAGSIRGHTTVQEAVADDTCLEWMQQWWDEASRHLSLTAQDIEDYRAALLARFSNRAMRHRLEQIAADGSQKLPVRTLPVLALERARGRVPLGATRVLAAWVLHLRGMGAPVTDAAQEEVVALAGGRLPEAVTRVLTYLDPAVGADTTVTTTVLAQAEELARS